MRMYLYLTCTSIRRGLTLVDCNVTYVTGLRADDVVCAFFRARPLTPGRVLLASAPWNGDSAPAKAVFDFLGTGPAAIAENPVYSPFLTHMFLSCPKFEVFISFKTINGFLPKDQYPAKKIFPGPGLPHSKRTFFTQMRAFLIYFFEFRMSNFFGSLCNSEHSNLAYSKSYTFESKFFEDKIHTYPPPRLHALTISCDTHQG